MGLLRDLTRLAHKKLRVTIPSLGGGGGLTGSENADLGLTTPGAGGFDGAPTDLPPEPGMVSTALQGIQVSPTHVLRNKCPKGYTLVHMSGFLGLPHLGDTCVLTKVARALGLAHHRRGRGISSRDLRAALRVTRLVRHIERQLPHRVTHGRAPGTALVRRRP